MVKILVIEDAQNIQKLVGANLTARGHQVLVALNGEKGLSLAQLEHPDLILLDLMLPGMSGWDVLIALKADPRLRKIPVIIMTAQEQEREEDKVRSMKAAGYIIKPFAIDELMRQVKQALRKVR